MGKAGEETKPLSFQEMLFRLLQFWSARGCIVAHPYYQQVGAGTMNPATFLRVLGPEPWNVVYQEPSVRPDDGRYGENPNRLQQHQQLQVILKPDPGNPQEIYLQSLEAIGIRREDHDIRFVEDNWESPAIGAWGLGWEVWLNGLEITQFTYFQQAGSLTLNPPAVELTYGLERIVMALQGVADFRDITYHDAFSYGDIYLQGEQEHSAYYHELADVENLLSMYTVYEQEFARSTAAGKVLPAYDYLLKCSHTFNILDTRGAVGVTERAGYFARMRKMAREVAELYVAGREALGLPFLHGTAPAEYLEPAVDASALDWTADGSLPYVLEIGTEELPAAELDHVLAQMAEKVPALLAEARLTHGEVTVDGTPRRLTVMIADVAPASDSLVTEQRGPAASIAFDAEGKPTRAGLGFAKRFGAAPEDLEQREQDGKAYLFVTVREPGRPAAQVLSEMAGTLIDGLQFRKSMRWLPGSNAPSFSRPVRWLVSLLGDRVVPFARFGLLAGRETWPLRALGDTPVLVPSASAYRDVLVSDAVQVTLRRAARRDMIRRRAEELAAEVGGVVPDDDDLLGEVTNLIEQPTVFRGEYEARYLELPRAVPMAVMKKHQRYFPVLDASGELLPYFIGVRNGGTGNLDTVIAGNAHVIRARLADAAYFVREDVKRPLADFQPQLSLLTFHAELGSMLDKSRRIEKLSSAIAAMLPGGRQQAKTIARAAFLAKADLATAMVVEMTSLQGIVGRFYALQSGEDAAVADAIEQHYWSGGDEVPDLPGLVIGLADRLDSLAGFFAIGRQPTGSADPFGLRRAAVGVVQLLIGGEQRFDLRKAVRAALTHQPVAVPAKTDKQVLGFISGRLKVVLQDMGLRYDVVDAALAAHSHDPFAAATAARQLSAWVTGVAWEETLDAFARCVRITRSQDATFTVDDALFAQDEERALWVAVQTARQAVPPGSDVDTLMNAFVPLVPVVTAFFDNVLVMADDRAVRENRLGLLQAVASLATGIVDLSTLEGF